MNQIALTLRNACAQVFVPSKDGKVKVPMFIVHRNDIKLDGGNPTYLYAYGGGPWNLMKLDERNEETRQNLQTSAISGVTCSR